MVSSLRMKLCISCACSGVATLPVPIAQSPIVGAIVVLGGDIGLPLTPRISSQIGGNRALHAFRLFTANKSKFIIISGGNVFPQRGVEPEAYYTSEILKEWGIPSEAILIEGRSRNTYENAIETKKLLNARQIDKILLITSAFHMPRALATFRTAGIDATPSPSSYSIVNYSRPQILDWIPSIGNLGRIQVVIREENIPAPQRPASTVKMSPVQLIALDNQQAILKIPSLDHNTVLLLNSGYDPKWQVSVSGQPAKLLHANLDACAVHLKASDKERTIVFQKP